jgi:ectoine hydroxylase-related dioxygenase (phytanoyl-CoA dioxygenase family)
MLESFANQGYAVFPGFLDATEIDTLKAAVDRHVSADPRRHAYEYDDLAALIWHRGVTDMVDELMGGRYVFHHLHAARHDAGQKGVSWHQDYEQYPQTNRAHLMVHVFYYLNGLDGTVGDLLLVPGSQEFPVDSDALTFLGTTDLPGSVTVDDLSPGSVVIVHSGMWHARRAKPGGDDRPRFFIDTSYCQSEVRWPSYQVPGMLDHLRQRHVAEGGSRPWLFDEDRFYDTAHARKVNAALEGSVVLDLPQWTAS